MTTSLCDNEQRKRGKLTFTEKCLVCVAWLAVAGLCSAQESSSADDASKQAFQKVCSSCHPAEAVTVGRKTQAEWEETFFKMIEDQGAKGSDEDFGMAFDYLVRNYGRVNVNRAARIELSAVLGLSAEDANRILDYRRANGDFKDLDSLVNVPGIDAEKLKQGKEAISF